MIARVVLGPCPCQRCRQPVVWMATGKVRHGWIHESGGNRCPMPKAERAAYRRGYNAAQMRERRRSS